MEYSYAEGKLVITKIHDNRFHQTTPFNIGDAIYDVNGKTIPQIVNSLGKYIPASNSWGKVNKLKNKLLFSNNDSLSVKLERNGQNMEITAKTYLPKEIIVKKVPAPQNGNFWMQKRKSVMLTWASLLKMRLVKCSEI